LGALSVILLIGAAVIAVQSGFLDKIFGGGTIPPPGTTPPPAGGGAPGQLKFASVGDIDHEKATATNVVGSGASVLLLNGDFYYSGDAQSWWDTVMAPVHSMVVHSTIGNHDKESDAAVFGQPSFNMSWKDGPIAFVSVNTESLDEAFVKGELDKYEADTTVGAIIPFMHKPAVAPQGSHHAAENTGLVDLFKQYTKIKLVVSGHNHNYSRSKLMGQQTYVTVGTGGKDGTTGYPVQVDANHEVAFAGTPGILVCEYNNGNMTCNFVANGGGGSGGDTDSFTIQYAGAVTTPPATTTPPPAEGSEEESNYTRAYLAAIDAAKYQYTHNPQKYPDLYRPVTSVTVVTPQQQYSSYYSTNTGRPIKRNLPRNRTRRR